MSTLNLRLHQGAILLLLGAFAGALLVRSSLRADAEDATPVPDVVRAKRFELVSPAGKKAAEMTWWPGGPHVTLYGADGKERLDLGVVPGEEPQIVARDGAGAIITTFQLDHAGGHPSISFFYKGALRTKVGVGPMGHAVLGLNGSARSDVATFAIAEDGAPTLEVLGKDGKPIWKAP